MRANKYILRASISQVAEKVKIQTDRVYQHLGVRTSELRAFAQILSSGLQYNSPDLEISRQELFNKFLVDLLRSNVNGLGNPNQSADAKTYWYEYFQEFASHPDMKLPPEMILDIIFRLHQNSINALVNAIFSANETIKPSSERHVHPTEYITAIQIDDIKHTIDWQIKRPFHVTNDSSNYNLEEDLTCNASFCINVHLDFSNKLDSYGNTLPIYTEKITVIADTKLDLGLKNCKNELIDFELKRLSLWERFKNFAASCFQSIVNIFRKVCIRFKDDNEPVYANKSEPMHDIKESTTTSEKYASPPAILFQAPIAHNLPTSQQNTLVAVENQTSHNSPTASCSTPGP